MSRWRGIDPAELLLMEVSGELRAADMAGHSGVVSIMSLPRLNLVERDGVDTCWMYVMKNCSDQLIGSIVG
jgi:hypothetical protein